MNRAECSRDGHTRALDSIIEEEIRIEKKRITFYSILISSSIDSMLRSRVANPDPYLKKGNSDLDFQNH